MTLKIVTSLLGLTLLLNSGFSVIAQQTPADVAEEEAVRRQEAIQLLHMKLVDAQALHKAGRIIEAAKAYEDAYALFPRVGLAGANVQADKKAVVAGLVDTRLKLAEDARRRGDLQEADAQVKRALKVDPQNPSVIAFKLQNDKAIVASKGNVPSPDALSRVPEFQTEKIQTGTLVQDGRLLFEMGKIDEAEGKLRLAMQQDPDNKAADYYLKLIRDQRYQQEQTKRELSARNAIVEVEHAWVPVTKRDNLPFPNPMMRTNLIHTSPQREEIMAKLNSIRLNEVGYDGLPLVEVLKHLTDESIKRDPDKIGLNFMINPHSDAALTTTVPGTDPNAATPVPIEATVPAIDIASVTVKINPPLRNLRLADVLDAVVTSADQAIRYELRDYAVVFSPRPPDPIQLQTRTFKVDPNTFLQGLESVIALSLGDDIAAGGRGGRGGGGGQGNNVAFNLPRVQLAQVISRGGGGGGGGANREGSGINFVTKTNITQTVNDMVKAYFLAAGVSLESPKSVFFNDRTGILLVRATLQDLEIVEAAVETLNQAPPQVQIEAKIAEVSQQDSSALGFDWFLGNTLTSGGRIGLQGGSAPTFSGAPSRANPSGNFPYPGFGQTFINPFALGPRQNDNLVSSGLRNTFGSTDTAVPELGTISGILTDPQFRLVVRALEQRGGFDILASPKVTTLSGRQAQMAALDLRSIVTGTDTQNQQNTQATGNGNLVQNTGVTILYDVAEIPFGPSLDVIPYVAADGYSIQMTLIPSLTEFVGYDPAGDFVPVAATALGLTINAALPLPHLRIRQVTTSCNVYDGQTIVLGGMISDNVRRIKDKVPFLGDVPYVGRLFRSESNTTDKRNLVIFVTPTIIDPAGNRVHTDDELPFARNTIPPQPAASAAAQ